MQDNFIGQMLLNIKYGFVTGGEFLGQNVEIFIGDSVDGDDPGTLCAYGPTSDRQPEYIISCFTGAMSGQVVTIQNRFSGSLKLCDVQVLGECWSCICRTETRSNINDEQLLFVMVIFLHLALCCGLPTSEHEPHNTMWVYWQKVKVQ